MAGGPEVVWADSRRRHGEATRTAVERRRRASNARGRSAPRAASRAPATRGSTRPRRLTSPPAPRRLAKADERPAPWMRRRKLARYSPNSAGTFSSSAAPGPASARRCDLPPVATPCPVLLGRVAQPSGSPHPALRAASTLPVRRRFSDRGSAGGIGPRHLAGQRRGSGARLTSAGRTGGATRGAGAFRSGAAGQPPSIICRSIRWISARPDDSFPRPERRGTARGKDPRSQIPHGQIDRKGSLTRARREGRRMPAGRPWSAIEAAEGEDTSQVSHRFRSSQPRMPASSAAPAARATLQPISLTGPPN